MPARTEKTISKTNLTNDLMIAGWALVKDPDNKKHYWRAGQHTCACGRRTREDLGPHSVTAFDNTIPVYATETEYLCIPCLHARQKDKRITLQVQTICEHPEVSPYKATT